MFTKTQVIFEAFKEGLFLLVVGGMAIFILSIMGCVHGSETAPVDGVGLTAKTIPDASCTLLTSGDRVFCNGIEAHAQAWDCGMRESKHCYYYIHYADVSVPTDFTDTVCHIPYYDKRDCPAGSVVP